LPALRQINRPPTGRRGWHRRLYQLVREEQANPRCAPIGRGGYFEGIQYFGHTGRRYQIALLVDASGADGKLTDWPPRFDRMKELAALA